VSRVIITARAGQGLERCRSFLADKSETAIRRAAQAIEQRFLMQEAALAVGRPFPENPEWCEPTIPFGDSGYVALYRYEAEVDVVYVLAFRHQKEAGY
jgi:plasmid stabilization system protein ParE